MPKKDCILNLPGYSIKQVSGENPVLIEVSYRRVVSCIHCGNKKLRKKDSFIKDVSVMSLLVYVVVICVSKRINIIALPVTAILISVFRG